MPNSINNISFTTPYSAEAEELARRKQLAELLQAQSMQGIGGTEMAGPIAIRRSPLEAVAKIAQGLSSQYVQGQAKDEQKTLAERYQSDLADAISKYSDARTGATYNRPDMTGAGMTGGLDEQDMPRKPETVEGDPRKALIMALSSQFPELKALGAVDAKAIEEKFGHEPKFTSDGRPYLISDKGSVKYLDPTILPRDTFSTPTVDATNRQAGEDRRFAGVSGNTAATIAGQNQRFASVSGNTQAQLAQAQQHWNNMSANQRAEYDLAAQRLGISGQELFFNTGMHPPGAPPSLAQPPQPAQPSPVAPQPQIPQQPVPQGAPSLAPIPPQVQAGRNAEQVAILTRELQNETNPQNRAAIQAEIDKLSGAPFRPAGPDPMRPAAPVVNAPAPITNAPVIDQVSPRERQKLLEARPHAQQATISSLQSMERLAAIASELHDHKGLSAITGKVNQYGALDLTPQTRAARGLQNTLVSQVGIRALQDMRDASKTGGAVGQVTEKEWPILQQSIAALDAAQGTADYQKALKNLQSQVASSMANIRKAYEATYGPLQYQATQHTSQRRSEITMPSISDIDAELARRGVRR